MKYGKIINGELVFIDPTKTELTDNGYVRMDKTEAELDGAKPVVYSDYPTYQYDERVVVSYDDSGDTIIVVYTVEKLPEELIPPIVPTIEEQIATVQSELFLLTGGDEYVE